MGSRVAGYGRPRATGVRSYVLFSEAAVKAMQNEAALVPFSHPFEHSGEVSMQVYDLARAWEEFRSGRERHFMEEADGAWTYRYHFDLPIAVV